MANLASSRSSTMLLWVQGICFRWGMVILNAQLLGERSFGVENVVWVKVSFALVSYLYTSRKIKNEIRVKEDKPPLVNQQCVVYSFKCDLCDAGYVGYTCRHLHQRIEEHKGSVIGDHLRNKHGIEPDNITRSFNILRKCKNKLDCLIFEMLFIKELKPTLNKQCDSIRAKLFV